MRKRVRSIRYLRCRRWVWVFIWGCRRWVGIHLGVQEVHQRKLIFFLFLLLPFTKEQRRKLNNFWGTGERLRGAGRSPLP